MRGFHPARASRRGTAVPARKSAQHTAFAWPVAAPVAAAKAAVLALPMAAVLPQEPVAVAAPEPAPEPVSEPVHVLQAEVIEGTRHFKPTPGKGKKK